MIVNDETIECAAKAAFTKMMSFVDLKNPELAEHIRLTGLGTWETEAEELRQEWQSSVRAAFAAITCVICDEWLCQIAKQDEEGQPVA